MKTPAQKLLCTLSRELYQAEASALTHARREAKRLGETSPATAMFDVSNHAARVVKALPALFEARNVGSFGFLGAVAGFTFSMIRRLGVDFILGQERSYRMTLLGLRHCIDLVYELQQLASNIEDRQLTEWCRTYLEQRVPLVTAVEKQLVWFVTHPERALQGA